MQTSSINTTNEKFLDSLIKHFDLNRAEKYFSGVDSEFEELFAEVLGKIFKSSVYISKNLSDQEKENTYSLENGKAFRSKDLLDLGYRKVERVWEEGEFSLLGDVVVIWSYSMSNILRVSL